MKKWKWFLFTLIVIVLFIVLVHFPSLLIQKQYTYNSFIVYSNDELSLDETAKSTYDLVLDNISKSHFYQSDQVHHLFFVHGTFYEKMVRLIGYKNMAFAFFNNSIYSAIPDFENQKLHRNDNEYEVMNLVQIISHEVVHNQVHEELGFWEMTKIPTWINEGYPEYISYIQVRKDVDYKIQNLIQRLNEDENAFWIKNEFGYWTTRPYTRDRTCVEYLLDMKKMSYEELKTVNPSEINFE